MRDGRIPRDVEAVPAAHCHNMRVLTVPACPLKRERPGEETKEQTVLLLCYCYRTTYAHLTLHAVLRRARRLIDLEGMPYFPSVLGNVCGT